MTLGRMTAREMTATRVVAGWALSWPPPRQVHHWTLSGWTDRVLTVRGAALVGRAVFARSGAHGRSFTGGTE